MDKIHKVLKSGKVVCSMRCSQSICDKIKELTQSDEGVLNALLHPLEVVDPLVGGTIAGNVGSEPSVLKEVSPPA